MACVPDGSGVRPSSLSIRACGSNPPLRDCDRASGAARQTEVAGATTVRAAGGFETPSAPADMDAERGLRPSAVWKPPVLSLPERHPFDETRIDDKARWTAACARYLGLVERLCRNYRREFPAAKYGASALGGLRERLALLQQFGGVPKSVLSLNSVPAEQLEEAVEAFAECFGLTGDAATGHLEGTPSATRLDPAPLNAGTLEVPW